MFKKVRTTNSAKLCIRVFPDGPVVKTPGFHCRGHGLDLWSGTKVLHTLWCGKKRGWVVVVILQKSFFDNITEVDSQDEE